ncbi:MAG: bifunctional hydroxymethylpyrimidine kinase/phosphomethylpyrimidine kinase [Lachnospiraceae bacterium]|nr:bifunctional hydroxymethylpyrimidine kinase/phosphomethylpyrimidine kinase [Lachnospiraceae bacterium]
MRKTALTIAGSDCSGGAGIQADIKTMMANGVYAMSAVTALTAQNTTGVAAIQESAPEFLAQQLDCVFTDIYPDAVKIGMVSSAELIRVIAEKLKFYHAKNIVVDPVMVATSGSRLLSGEALDTLQNQLLPLATVVTPNIPEAEILADQKITCAEDMIAAARKISETWRCAVLLKGGHSLNDANDLLCRCSALTVGHSDVRSDGTQNAFGNDEKDNISKDEKGRENGNIHNSEILTWFYGRRVENPNTHGTGCTLSSAIAANLAKGCDLEEAICRAKEYLSRALEAMLDLGKGSGPLDHGFMCDG